MTIGPLANATAMMRGSLPNPNRRISKGTSASIGVAGGSGTVNYSSGMLGDTTAASYTFGSTLDSGVMNIANYSWSVPVTFNNGSGRPMYILEDREVVKELV